MCQAIHVFKGKLNCTKYHHKDIKTAIHQFATLATALGPKASKDLIGQGKILPYEMIRYIII